MVAPLTKLLCHWQFSWNQEADDAFQNLKNAFTATLVLALLDFSAPFVVETDASGSGMGAVLTQGGHPLAYFSKQFCPKLLNSSTYVCELAAITTAVRKWCQYLLGHHFIILTDHRSLRELMNQAIQTPEQHRYLALLLGFGYTIQYRVGRSNVVADALSRVMEGQTASLYLLSIPQFVFLDDLRKELASLATFLDLRDRIQEDPAAYGDYTLTKGLILHRLAPL